MAKISPYTFWQALDSNGNPLSGGKLYTYDAGTSTNKQTFVDQAESAVNANPIILDADGRANIWLDTGSYKFVLKDSADVTVSTVDNITGDTVNVFGSSVTDIAVNTAIGSGNQNEVVNCTAALTLSLLNVATALEGFVFSVKNSSSGNVVIDPDGLELINGLSTITLSAGQSALLVCDGTGWLSIFISTLAPEANNTFTGDNTFTGTNTYTGESLYDGVLKIRSKLTATDDGERTIASGSISVTGVNHTVDTEADASADDLDTISSPASGQWLILRVANASRVVTVKHGTGNVRTPDGNDIVLDSTDKLLYLMYDTEITSWLVLSVFDTGSTKKDTIVTQSSATAIGTATWTSIAFNTEDIDDGSWHDNATNNSRVTVDATGVYNVSGSVLTDETGNGDIGVAIAVNGTIKVRHLVDSGATAGWGLNISQPLYLTNGDYVELQVYNQNAGKNTVIGGTMLAVGRG